MPPTHLSYEQGEIHEGSPASEPPRSVPASDLPAEVNMQPLMINTGTPPQQPYMMVPVTYDAYGNQIPLSGSPMLFHVPWHQQPLNINAQSFEPSPSTTATPSPVHFDQGYQQHDVQSMPPQDHQIPVQNQPVPVQSQPIPVQSHPEVGVSTESQQLMYHHAGSQPIPVHTNPTTSYVQTQPIMYSTPPPAPLQMYPNTATSYSTPPHGSPAPYTTSHHTYTPPYGSPAQMASPAPPMYVYSSGAVHQGAEGSVSVPALPQIQRLNLNNVPMYKPKPAHNLQHPTDMAQVWHGEFQKKFTTFGNDLWELIPHPDGYHGHHDGIFEDTAKIRFVCKNCSHAWTSMQGKVKFWYKFNAAERKGQVVFQLFGQKCKSCKEKNNVDDIQDALWYPDEILKVVHNVHCKVGMIYYNIQRPQLMIQRRVGRPKGQHNADLCAACQDGICRRNSPNANV